MQNRFIAPHSPVRTIQRRGTYTFAVALLALALITAACGGDDAEASTPTAKAGVADTPTAVATEPAPTATTEPAPTATSEPAPTATSVPPTATSEPSPTATSAPLQTEFTISAENVSFDTASFTIPAGQKVTITFVNYDDGTPHNLHIKGPNGFDEKTEIFRGSEGRSRDLVFTATEPGQYSFVCDVHSFMTGTMTVK